MFIRSKMESKSQQRKKLSISSSKSNSSNSHLKVSEPIPENRRSSFFKPIMACKNDEQENITDKHQAKQLPSLNKQNIKRKKSISLYRKQPLPEEIKDKARILRPSRRNISKQNINYNLPGIESKFQKDRNGDNKKISNSRLVISHLLSGSTNKTENFKQTATDETDSPSLLKSQVYENRRLSSIKKCNTIYISKEQNELLDNADQTYSNFINENYYIWSETSHLNKTQRLSLDSSTVQCSFVPTRKHYQVDVQVQTIQQEKEFFQYLKYKRRKQQFQDEVQNLFTEIQPIKNDRASYQDRILKLHSFQSQDPENQRQKRIFNLKNQISRQQKNIQKMIVEKYTSFEKFIVELQKLEQTLAVDNEKFVDSFLKHCKLQKDEFCRQNQVEKFEKYLKSFANLKITICHYLKQNLKKVIFSLNQLQNLMIKYKPPKQETTQLIQAFSEYKKSIYEQKGLLKNCFGQIKKVPELCYGLCGDQLLKIDVKSQLRNENNEFEMPKCINCFNSEWKLHMIIEKNVSMQSIFKVTQQLLM